MTTDSSCDACAASAQDPQSCYYHAWCEECEARAIAAYTGECAGSRTGDGQMIEVTQRGGIIE